jgi:branched-chain amino acid transport system permease protein
MIRFIELFVSGITVGGVYALVALGFTLVFRATKIFNFAVGNFVAISGLACWTFVEQLHMPMAVGVLAGILAGALLGFLVDRVCLRPMIGQPVLSTTVMTLALTFVLSGLAVLVWGGVPKSYPTYMPTAAVEIVGSSIALDVLLCFAVAMAVTGIIALYFERAKGGLFIRATGEDHQVARSCGIRVKNVFTSAWVIGGVACAFGGILLGTIRGLDLSLPEFGLKVIPAVLIGGLESIPGAVLGGFIIGVLERLAGGYINPVVGGGFETAFAYIVMIVFLYIKPYGLFGLERIERV